MPLINATIFPKTNNFVAFTTSNSSGTVRYTVPAGRTWRGHMFANTGAASPQCNINNVSIEFNMNASGYVNFPLPVTLPPGAIVSDGSQAGFTFVGIEE